MFNRIAKAYIKIIQKILPSPFTIALILTAICVVLALYYTKPTHQTALLYSLQIVDFWGNGLWGLLEFASQMMLILVFGHAIALSKPADKVMAGLLGLCHSNTRAAFVVTLTTVLCGYINWGLGLIFGAVLARKVFEYASVHRIAINYPLIGACGYTGLMVWHGGLSGSAPLTVAQQGHTLYKEMGIIDLSETLFSNMNLTAFLGILVLLPLTAYFLGKLQPSVQPKYTFKRTKKNVHRAHKATGAEKLDTLNIMGYGIGILIIAYWIYSFMRSENSLRYVGLNTINLLFFGLAIFLHGNIKSFLSAVDKAIKGAAGILIQFPLYAGIMGILSQSGLMEHIANFFIAHSNTTSFPLFAFASAAFVNILVPSGGGQWQIQGPVLIEAAKQLHVSLGKTTMAMAYGDQLTNMLQPFWALPLLSITQLKAKDILPYSLVFMLVGLVVYSLCLLVF